MHTVLERSPRNSDLAQVVTILQSEIDKYRRESETLSKINTLHQRMASILDLAAMLEAYSIWLQEYVHHDLLGYNNPKMQRRHMFCSHHGQRRRQAITLAESLLTHLDQYPKVKKRDEFYIYRWSIQRDQLCENLTVIRLDSPFSQTEIAFIEETLPILGESLRRALEFEYIATQVRKDPLTGLANRVVFEERTPIIMEQAKRHGHPLTLAALDLDHFKSINDAMGHLMGDKVLQSVARSIHEQIRQTDLLVRIGGDEFILVLPETTVEEAGCLAQRVCDAVRHLNIHAGNKVLGISIGLSQWDMNKSMEQWLEVADNRLYQAKAAGKSQVLYH
ncbi:MAG: GGDEF domain-containing protein [Desulfobulbus propionicus]|nr:MAG: GGDEF domain-containing protein [Desulfobulbus propionicus]